MSIPGASARRLRLALIGAGRWGTNIIRTVDRLPGIELAVVASRNPDAPAMVPPGCRVMPDWRESLADAELDGVIVATPPATHAAIAHECLSRGVPVLIEKPVTMDLAEAEALCGAAARTGGIVLVDHTHLFAPAYRTLKDNLGQLGRIRRIECQGGNRGPFRTHSPMLWDYGPHDVAFCLDLTGSSPLKVSAVRTARTVLPDGTGEAVEIGMIFPGEVTARIQLSNIADRKTRLLVVDGTHGRLTYDDTRRDKLVLATAEGGCTRLPFSFEPPLDVVIRRFATAVEAGRASLGDVHLGRDVVQILSGCAAALAREPDGMSPDRAAGARHAG